MRKIHQIIEQLDAQLDELKKLSNYAPQTAPPNKLEKIDSYIDDSSKLFGVTRSNSGKYRARARTGNTITSGGTFDTPEAANRQAIQILIDYERTRPHADIKYLDELQHRLNSRPW